MSVKCVAHIVESTEPDAGSIGAALCGLDAALEPHGLIVQTCAVGIDSSAGNDANELGRTVREADVVHVFGWCSPGLRRAARMALRAGKRLMVTPFGALSEIRRRRLPLGERLRERFGGRRLLGAASVLTAINEFERHEIGRYVQPTCLRILPMGVDVGRFTGESLAVDKRDAAMSGVSTSATSAAGATERMRSADEFDPRGCVVTTESVEEDVDRATANLSEGRIALVLGPIDPIEGIVALLKAFAEVGAAADGWNVVIAGPATGPWRRQLEAAVLRKGGSDRVCFAEASRPEVQTAWLRRASLAVCVPLAARCPVFVIQAVAAGVPVIATHHVVPAGMESSIRVCAGTRAEIRNALRELLPLSDDQLGERASTAFDTCARSIDWSEASKAYAELYQQAE